MGVFELFPLEKKGMISFCFLKTRNLEGGERLRFVALDLLAILLLYF